MKRFLREPLLHFLLLGAAIFAVYGWRSQPGAGTRGTILITQSQIASMAENFARTWQRQPSPSELDGLIQDRIREEVYSREAMALGLGEDDTVIRRRLRQKMEFISDDVAAQAEPTEGDLNAFLKAHPESFRAPRTFTFRHVFLNPAKRGDDLARDAARLLEQLSRVGEAADLSALGDPFLLDYAFASASSREVASLFGESFAAKLSELPAGEWQGPVESGYGVHLVFIRERTEGRQPDLAEVREAVRRQWESARRQEANERLYREMLGRYTVTIEGGEDSGQQGESAEAR